MDNSINLSGNTLTQNQTFSVKRLLNYSRIFLAENGRSLLLQLGVMFIVILLLFLFDLYISGISNYNYLIHSTTPAPIPPERLDLMWNEECDMIRFLIGVFATLSGAAMFSSMSSKSGRQSTILIPASQFEKFFAWFAVYLPCFIIATWGCFYVADILRMAWTKCFTDYGDFAHIIPFADIFKLTPDLLITPDGINVDTLFSVSLAYSVFIILNASYALGSILFHRLAFVKTSVSLFILMQVCGLMAYLGTRSFFTDGHYTYKEYLGHTEVATSVTCWIITILSAAIIYGLSYRRFKESEIIARW